MMLAIRGRVVSLLVSELACFLAGQLQIRHKHAQHITGDFKVAIHMYHSEYASVN